MARLLGLPGHGLWLCYKDYSGQRPTDLAVGGALEAAKS